MLWECLYGVARTRLSSRVCRLRVRSPVVAYSLFPSELSTRPRWQFGQLGPHCHARSVSSARGVSLGSKKSSEQQQTETSGTYGYYERLALLRRGEKQVAVFAGVSLIVGYFAFKFGMKKMAEKKAMADKASAATATAASSTAIPQPPTPTSGPRPLVIAGPSGSGKSTFLRMLFKEYPDVFGFSVSHTTRKPRPGEVDGREYHFTTRADMKKMIDKGQFIEWAEFSGNMYGTSKKAVSVVLDQGKVCVLDIDMEGVRSIKKTKMNPLYLLVKPPSLEILEERLRKRKTDSDEVIQRRISIAKTELEYGEGPGVFDHILLNDQLEESYKKLREILQEAKLIPAPKDTT